MADLVGRMPVVRVTTVRPGTLITRGGGHNDPPGSGDGTDGIADPPGGQGDNPLIGGEGVGNTTGATQPALRELTVQANGAVVPVIIGGPLPCGAFIIYCKLQNDFLYIDFAWGEGPGPADALTNFKFGDKAIADLGISPPEIHTGEGGDTHSALIAEVEASYEVPEGIIHAAFKLARPSQETGDYDPFQCTADVKGIKCYDDRTAETVWTKNAIVAAIHCFRNTRFGPGADPGVFNMTQIEGMENGCDTVVGTDGASVPIKRWEISMRCDRQDTFENWMKLWAQHCQGAFLYSGGQWGGFLNLARSRAVDADGVPIIFRDYFTDAGPVLHTNYEVNASGHAVTFPLLIPYVLAAPITSVIVPYGLGTAACTTDTGGPGGQTRVLTIAGMIDGATQRVGATFTANEAAKNGNLAAEAVVVYEPPSKVPTVITVAYTDEANKFAQGSVMIPEDGPAGGLPWIEQAFTMNGITTSERAKRWGIAQFNLLQEAARTFTLRPWAIGLNVEVGDRCGLDSRQIIPADETPPNTSAVAGVEEILIVDATVEGDGIVSALVACPYRDAMYGTTIDLTAGPPSPPHPNPYATPDDPTGVYAPHATEDDYGLLYFLPALTPYQDHYEILDVWGDPAIPPLVGTVNKSDPLDETGRHLIYIPAAIHGKKEEGRAFKVRVLTVTAPAQKKSGGVTVEWTVGSILPPITKQLYGKVTNLRHRIQTGNFEGGINEAWGRRGQAPGFFANDILDITAGILNVEESLAGSVAGLPTGGAAILNDARTFVSFDPTVLPDDATLVGLRLGIYGTAGSTPDDVVVVKSTASEHAVSGEMDLIDHDADNVYARFPAAEWTLGGYNVRELSATARAAFDRTLPFRIALVGGHDFDNIKPVLSYLTRGTGTEDAQYGPRLYVTFTSASSGGGTTTIIMGETLIYAESYDVADDVRDTFRFDPPIVRLLFADVDGRARRPGAATYGATVLGGALVLTAPLPAAVSEIEPARPEIVAALYQPGTRSTFILVGGHAEGTSFVEATLVALRGTLAGVAGGSGTLGALVAISGHAAGGGAAHGASMGTMVGDAAGEADGEGTLTSVGGVAEAFFVDDHGYVYDETGAAFGSGATPAPDDTTFGYYYNSGTDATKVGPAPTYDLLQISDGTSGWGGVSSTGGGGASTNCLIKRGIGDAHGVVLAIECPRSIGFGDLGDGTLYLNVRDATTMELLYSRHATEIEDFITASADPYSSPDDFIFNDLHVSADPDGTFWVNTCVGGTAGTDKAMWHVAADGTLIGDIILINPVEDLNRIARFFPGATTALVEGDYYGVMAGLETAVDVDGSDTTDPTEPVVTLRDGGGGTFAPAFDLWTAAVATFIKDYIDAHPNLFGTTEQGRYYGTPNWHITADPGVADADAEFIDHAGRRYDGATGALLGTGGTPVAAKDTTWGYSSATAGGGFEEKAGGTPNFDTLSTGGAGTAGYRGPVTGNATTITQGAGTMMCRPRSAAASFWISLFGGPGWGDGTTLVAAMFEVSLADGTLIRTIELDATNTINRAHRVAKAAPFALEAGTKSAHRVGCYAKYFTFTMGSGASVTLNIDLTSKDFDGYLYLMEGDGTGGGTVAEDDSSGPGPGVDDARIALVTPAFVAKTYTVEVTSFSPGEVGGFDVTLDLA